MIKNKYTSKDFDYFVDVLIGRWQGAIEWQVDWPSFDEEQRASLTEDWPVNNDIHQRLTDYVANHKLTEEQRSQWARLNKLVAEHKKHLEDMGYRVLVPAPAKGREAA